MFRAFACLVMARSCAGSIIALRSANLLCRALLPKIVLQRQLANLGMQRLHVDSRLPGSVAAAGTEHIGCPFLELRLPGCDLIGVDVELLRKLSQSSIALQGRKRHINILIIAVRNGKFSFLVRKTLYFAQRVGRATLDDRIGFRRERAHCGASSERERIRQVLPNGTRSQSGRCASSYSIS